MVASGEELVKICRENGIPIWEYAIREEALRSETSREEVVEKMRRTLHVMMDSSTIAQEQEVKSISGLIGGDAYKIRSYADRGNTLTGSFINRAMARAMSASEVNAAMGRIVACPTAGSCGILPAVILSAGEELHKTEDELVNALFTAAGVGIIIARNATLAGAEGGCQAECGSAAAMASAAVVEMMGGTPEQALNAAAIVIKNVLGLVCDPVAGLVEVPCAKRNVAGTVSALTTADLVMSGVASKIPFDEVVEAMYRVGRQMPAELRETALGGVAITPTALRLKKEIYKD
ncbi:MAG: L-serine ammonia-lyase, iron-sulfur-dependent, subunit alpha [Bacillota bacterium]|nr:L-serine ammonia-lyase, iron-sulfur-dependent, subunit alpha [Bacillota bacterium]HPZ22127.1 L-serine ammonia-lyase, iron-sulfur-dependent, subunit alpha [Bacillota bacterium]HQD20095.1 L-serine ammonia-lyase, iron-sulfur-dependent, subunit alpha [Bacillota bacterium]